MKGMGNRVNDNVIINHKGQWCTYTDKDALLCQEGYCSECEIHRKYMEELESLWE